MAKELFENPLVRSIALSWLMRALAVGGTALVTKGILTQEQANAINWSDVAGTILVLVSFTYGTVSSYRSRQKIVTSLANPHCSTEAHLELLIKDGQAASVRTPKDETPQ